MRHCRQRVVKPSCHLARKIRITSYLFTALLVPVTRRDESDITATSSRARGRPFALVFRFRG